MHAKNSRRVVAGEIQRQSKFRVSRDTVANRVGDQVVLVQVETDRIFSLNPTAARLWELLSSSLNRAEIQAKLMLEFDVSEATLSSEIDEMLNKFLKEQLIDIDNGNSGI